MSAQKTGPHRILVVEDDPMVRDYVSASLTSHGFIVTTAGNGADALLMLSSGSEVDLLFTDILMEGGINGWELAEQARALHPDLPVLFTSGYPASLLVPPDGLGQTPPVLRKPYRQRDLAAAVKAAIASTADGVPRAGTAPASTPPEA